MEKFSVSMCVYGGDNPQWFSAAVDSVINQTVKPDEIVQVLLPNRLRSWVFQKFARKPV